MRSIGAYFLYTKIMQTIIGIDEAGRGAWAGPLVVGAVGLNTDIPGLMDSKLLSPIKRRRLSAEIKDLAFFFGIGWVSPSEVDDLGLTEATTLACRRALQGAPEVDKIIIDGHINYLPDIANSEFLIDGDNLQAAISAASIIAKVARDEYMAEQSKIFPEFGFETHVGYGTRKHSDAIKNNGLTPLHRWSFKPVKKFLEVYEA